MDPNSLKVTELKAELTARGLSTKGLKKELVTRLEEALASEGGDTSNADKEVAPKPNADTNDNDNEEEKEDKVEDEAKEIAKVIEPVQEPKAPVAESDVVMTAVPLPADSTSLSSSAGDILSTVTAATTTLLEPVVGTPTLSQEGLIDTTRATSSTTATDSNKKKRQLETDESTATENQRSDHKEPAKRLRQDSAEHAKIRAAATEAVEADARRRSAAPSPSPAPGRSGSTASISTVASSSLTPGPSSPTEDRNKSAGTRRIDARSIMERQIKLAIQDRKPEGSSSLSTAAESKPLATVDEDMAEESTAGAPLPAGEATRSLVITNFVRPLTVPQVKRMLSEFGEVEVFWMDNIKSHGYVTFKTVEAAQKAYKNVVGQVFPKETGKPLQALFLTPETAADYVAAAEEAQKSGKRPIIYSGKPVVPTPKRGAAITVRKDEVNEIFKSASSQVIKPTDLFKMTTAQPQLYYKAAKEPPTLTNATSQEAN
ncbi:hypothetical protein BGZ83_005630 [Gryganskiella cystojenkinii]|nr:hypothetical protein BGZ83_005630 [Gryganskiella cystojenkinii]